MRGVAAAIGPAARSRVTMPSSRRRCRSRSDEVACGTASDASTSRSTSKPASTACRRSRLWVRRPVTATTITATASCPATSTRRPVRAAGSAVARPEEPARAANRPRTMASIGASAAMPAAASAIPAQNRSTRASIATVSIRGRPGGAHASMAFKSTRASGMAPAVAATASTRLSTSIWPARRLRLAPSAARTASSGRRASPRIRSSVATLAHARSSTRTTAAKSARTAGRTSPSTASSNRRSTGRSSPGTPSRTCPMMGRSARSSWSACAGVVPARTRAITSSSLATAPSNVSFAAAEAMAATVVHASVPRG